MTPSYQVTRAGTAAPVVEDPRYENEEYKEQMPDLTLVRDVYTGSRVIKSKRTEYLPQEPKETDQAYAIRLKRSGWWAGYRKTIRALVGMVFRKPPVFSEGLATQIEQLGYNINLQGDDLASFVKFTFGNALNDGHAYILVDMPPPLDPQVATLADEQGRRPYWTLRLKDQVINWRKTTSNSGEITLEQCTIHETVCEPAGRYEEEVIDQWRVLRLEDTLTLVGGETGEEIRSGKRLVWEIYRVRKTEGNKEQVYLYDEGTAPVDFIPLVPLYTNKTGFFTSDPPLKDLADLNISHYQINSDYRHILHVANVPILVFVGREEGDSEQEIGPNAGIDVPPGGDVKYVEHAGSAIGAARQEIQDTERRMGVIGLELLAPRSDVEVTATQSAIDDSSQISELGAMVESIDDAVNQALDYTAQFLQLEDAGGFFKGNKDFQRLKLDSTMLSQFSNMVMSGQLRVESLWYLMERAELVPPEFDPEVEKAGIGEQSLLGVRPEPAPFTS